MTWNYPTKEVTTKMTISIPDINLEGDSPENQPQTDSPQLKAVATLLEEYDKLEADLEKLAAMVTARAERKREILEASMPNAMAEAGVTMFKGTNGRKVEIETVCRGNIPALSTVEKARGQDRVDLQMRRNRAVEVVRVKWPGLIKTEVSVSLGRGETDVATRIAELIRKEFQLTPSVDETINPQTLNSHFRDLKEQGKLEEIPVEPFALYVGPIAKIK